MSAAHLQLLTALAALLSLRPAAASLLSLNLPPKHPTAPPPPLHPRSPPQAPKLFATTINGIGGPPIGDTPVGACAPPRSPHPVPPSPHLTSPHLTSPHLTSPLTPSHPRPSLGAPGTSTMALRMLSSYPQAVCNDGSPGGYYYAAADNSSSADLWLVYLEGAMFCWDEASCQERYATHEYWMSSAGCEKPTGPWASTYSAGCIPMWNPQFAQGGIFATDGSSPWGGANRVYVKCAQGFPSPPPRAAVSPGGAGPRHTARVDARSPLRPSPHLFLQK